MAKKILLDSDPGVGDAVATCVALGDPRLEVVAITATGGVVPPGQATHNVQAVVESLDPAPRPRLGAADPDQPLRTDARDVFGPDGLCGAPLAASQLQNRRPSAKVIADELRASSGDLTILAGGPLTNIAKVLQGEPDLATRVGHLVIAGGTLDGPGDVTAAAEFNIYCDAESARQVFNAPITTTIVPLDVSTRVTLELDLLEKLQRAPAAVSSLLTPILTGAFRAFRQRHGLEAVLVQEAVALAAAVHPEVFETESLPVDVETAGELTYGATVFDRRHRPDEQPNVEVAVSVDEGAVLDFILRGLLNGNAG